MGRNKLQTGLKWAPRVLGILMTLFVSLFALDVFGAGYSPLEALLALIIHLLPFAGVLLGWRWPWVGGLIFIGFCLFYITMTWGKEMLAAVLLLAGLPILIGLLFLLDSYLATRPRPLA
jgi:hypothetical protein